MQEQFEQLQQMELKANLNEHQKEFLEKLKAELEQISAGYNAEELAERGYIRSLEMFVEKKREIMDFLQTKMTKEQKELYNETIDWVKDELTPINPEGLLENKQFDFSNPPKIVVFGDLDLRSWNPRHLPKNLIVKGSLFLTGSGLLNDLPDSLIVEDNLHIGNCSKKVEEKARELQKKDRIKGQLLY